MPIRVDVSEAMALGGFLEEISVKIGTPQYIGPVLKYVHAKMSDAFTEYMATLAPANPSKFHHVYEWGAIGDPRQQLWRDVLVGHGNTRVATFEWLASQTIVPVVHEDAIGRVQEVHVFTWKAPVMEYDTDLTISPKRGPYLVYFTGPPGAYTPEDLHIVKDQSITVQFPGGKDTKGSFTEEYVAWWAGEGARVEFNSNIRQLLEHDLADMPLQSVTGEFRTGTRSRSKTIGLITMASAEAAKDAGRMAARRWLAARNRKYIAGAQARSDLGAGLSE